MNLEAKIEIWQHKFKLLRRSIRFYFQRRIRGWDDSDTWSLDQTIARFALPRLRRFKELNIAHPNELTEEEWNRILGELEWFLALHSNVPIDLKLSTKTDLKRYKKASKYFGKYFGALWW